MKQIYVYIILFLFVFGGLFAQNNIVGYEYWLDDAYADKQSMQVSPVENFQWQATIPYSDLTNGLHMFNSRFKDQNGYWSSIVSSYFYRMPTADSENSITGYEYWLDDDYSAAVKESVTASSVVQLSQLMDFENLPTGLHQFNSHFKDKNGYWSSIVSSYFYRMPTVDSENSITGYEYWLDDDYSAAVKESVTASSVVQLSQLIDFENLPNGLHRFNSRFKDKNGYWSSIISSYFYKTPVREGENSIVEYEYWLNEDYENKVSNTVQNLQTFIMPDSIDVSLTTEPKNSISLRFKDETGQWSSVFTNVFYRPAEAGFTHITGLSDAAFTNTSRFADVCEWDFGDGETSHQINPRHAYEPGVYSVKLTVENENNSDNVIHDVEINGIRTISSNRGGNGGIATVTFYGGGLTDNTQVIVTNGGNQITGENITLITKGELEVEFNLTGLETGLYDIKVIDNATFGEIVLANAYTVEETKEPEVWTEIVGNDVLLVDRWQTYTVNFGNDGNVDAQAVPIWLAFSDVPDLEIEFVDFEVLPPEIDYEIDEALKEELLSMPIFLKVDTFQNQPFAGIVYPLIIPKIPANYAGQVKVRIKSGQSVKFRAWIDEPLVDYAYNEESILLRSSKNSNLRQFLKCVIFSKLLTEAQTILGYVPVLGSFTDVFFSTIARRGAETERISWMSFRWNATFTIIGCIMDEYTVITSPTIAGAFAFSAGGIIVNTIGGIGSNVLGLIDCARNFPPLGDPSNSEKNIQQAISYDPNEIVGPSGYGDQHYIQKRNRMSYTLYFENDAELATAPAQEILLIDTLDLTKFDPEVFSFNTFTFRDTTVKAIPGITEFSQDIDMRGHGEDIIIRVSATFDKEKGIIRWHMIALDPETMDLTENPYLGVLYPNVTSPVGEGNVSYSIGLRPELESDAVIENRAYITFDLNEPIVTNTWQNVIDGVKPASSMSALPAIASNTTFTVSWNGSDALSGVRHYNVYVAENDGEYDIWQYSTTETSATFTGNWGSAYSFYCIAVDNAGNVENVKTVEASTLTECRLNSLTVSEGILTPGFSPAIFEYTVALASGVESITIDAETAIPNAVISGDTGNNALVSGNNDFTVSVSAGQSVKTYTVRVVRSASSDAALSSLEVSSGTLSPAFDAHTTSYRVDVENETTLIDVRGTASHSLATVYGNVMGKTLEVGDNVVNITVTAEDGTDMTYTVTVIRAVSSASMNNPEIRASDKVIVYPNPVSRSETLQLKLPETFVGGVLDIYDIKGSLRKSRLPLPATVNSINVSDLNPGIYLMHVISKDGKRHEIKLIIE
ncbi:MAG: cadherin-like beta sandwich domain-containing protein [Tannerella sp.]|jgi:hypothetical protein|nr:cadherin-like beta sandwich domain-containing protein [Tannerella sp.]